ncbi:MAG: M28 family peptidase [Promethearchaeota archaeon]|nr:MAG: M28 family peptidase [Candidatus Lokiarchaeota archaeon]
MKRKDLTDMSALLEHNIAKLSKIIEMRDLARSIMKDLPEPINLEIPDNNTIFNWVEEICETPHRRPGTPEGHRAEDYLVKKLKELGLENVTKDPIDITVWEANNWKLIIEENGQTKEFPCFYIPRTGFTGPEGITGELVYVGQGLPEDLENIDLKGKIAVVDIIFAEFPTGLTMKLDPKYGGGGYYFSDPDDTMKRKVKHRLIFVRKNFPREVPGVHPGPNSAYRNVHERGALAMIGILRNHPGNTNTYYGPYDRVIKPMPALWVAKNDGRTFREIAQRNCKATIIVEGYQKPGVTHNVWGLLPGKSDEIILVSSHHDAPFKGATEDGTGIAMVLAQIKAWSKLSKEQRPRTLLFVCDAGHFWEACGPEYLVKHHPELIKRALADVNLEHVAAKDVVDKRGEFVFSGNMAFSLVYTTNNEYLISTVIRALEKNKPKWVSAVPFDVTGSVAAGDGGRYYQYGGLNVVNLIAMPYYLLTAEDTLDKVDKDELKTYASFAGDIIGTLMSIDKENLKKMN